MSTRIEWSRISDAELAEPRQLEDQYGSVNEGPALAFFTGSDGAVVEADSWGEMAEALAELANECQRRAWPSTLPL